VSIALKITKKFYNSKAVQIIRMFKKNRRIDFETWVDWKENEKLLKVAFPVAISSPVYSVDTSAGVLTHINNKNTSWQQAKFEVACHKWVEMSEGLFGAAILNDCKYGCDVNRDVMRLSLLRAPIRPDRHSDREEHYFTYSFLTHEGQWQKSELVEEAYNLNWPVKAYSNKGFKSDEKGSLIDIDRKGLSIQSVKLAEDDTNDIVVRLVEIYQTHGRAVIKPNFSYKEVYLCDLLERKIHEVDLNNIMYKPFEMMTLRFKR
jgi:alpha-mannosidase